MEAHTDAGRNRLHYKGQILKTIYCLRQQYNNTLDVYEIHRNKIYDKTAKMAGEELNVTQNHYMLQRCKPKPQKTIPPP